MQHPDEGTIHSWLDGALSADEAARVEAHVQDCPECTAAVAEARGFIAASSRILTALDNAPRGVIPIAAPKKRVDPIVWRIAATLLVVAGGTFAVFRSSGDKSAAPGFTTYEEPDTAPVPKFAPPITILGNPSRAAGGSSRPDVSSGNPGRAKVVAADSSTSSPPRALAGKSAGAVVGNAPAAVAPSVAYSATDRVSRPQANTPTALNQTVAGSAGITAEATAPPTKLLSPAGVGSVAALNAATEVAPVKNIGTRRQIGQRITLYEVEPGDTVTLTEVLNVQLEGVVVTGLSTAPTARQSTEKSAAAADSKRAVAPAVSTSDSQGAAAGVSSPAPAQAARAQTGNVLTSKTGNVQVPNGVATISWTDSVTGNVMKLSGRMSPARLQQVKTQIERERAAAAAKKKP
jgi:Putative zinc-finger